VVEQVEPDNLREGTLHLGVAPTKNPDRMEWLVEKCVEIGIEKISFVLCDHSERTHIDLKRMERIAIAALKQSQTTLLPYLEVIPLDALLDQFADKSADKLIAWCDPENDRQLMNYTPTEDYVLLLIGPEGDFSQEEIKKCKQLDFQEIKLGNRRLRTETAAMYGTIVLSEKSTK
jgi:16S rRNA (uracil1498-N3)-methyltransferase